MPVSLYMLFTFGSFPKNKVKIAGEKPSVKKQFFCSKSHNDRVLFEYTSAIWAHIARGKAECYMSPNSMSILK